MNAVAVTFSTQLVLHRALSIPHSMTDISPVMARDANALHGGCTISGHRLVEWLHSIEFQAAYASAFFIDAKLQERYNTLVL